MLAVRKSKSSDFNNECNACDRQKDARFSLSIGNMRIGLCAWHARSLQSLIATSRAHVSMTSKSACGCESEGTTPDGYVINFKSCGRDGHNSGGRGTVRQ